jgi:UDP:flavonoid glycosyltransferase YjiC (YdhE family)
VSPAGGDMGENAARADWARLGVRLPRRLCTPRGVRLAVRRLLDDARYAQAAAGVRDWCAAHDGATAAADELEAFVIRR